MRGVIDMMNVRSVAVAAAFTILWLGSFSVYSVPSASAGASATAATPEGKAAGATTGAPARGAAVSGKTTARSSVKTGTYVVRTVWKNAPLSNVRVEWRHQPDDAAPLLSGTTVRFGTANFRPASGTYYLTAEWRADEDFARPRKPGDRFAWLGGNPLLVSSETSEIVTLMLEEVSPLPSSPTAGTGVFGRVTLGGVPVADVGVYAYAKTGSGFKGDDFQATVRTNAKGEFALELPPDRYYLLARLRADNSVDLGPLHKEDLLGYDPRNPVVVVKGRFAPSAIPVARLKMVKSRAESSAFLPGTIEGRIVDRDGRPVRGAYAALYEKPSMAGRSVFRSEPAGADGRFKLSVPIPGSYFLGARSGYGSPVAGGWFGAWGGSADHSIQIKTGEFLAGVEIVVNRLSQ
jgi:hypothetical protein